MSMTLKCTTHELFSLTVATAGLQNSAQQRDAASTASSLYPPSALVIFWITIPFRPTKAHAGQSDEQREVSLLRMMMSAQGQLH